MISRNVMNVVNVKRSRICFPVKKEALVSLPNKIARQNIVPVKIACGIGNVLNETKIKSIAWRIDNAGTAESGDCLTLISSMRILDGEMMSVTIPISRKSHAMKVV